ncbi:putative phage tail assembly chaperone [Mannheimia haemolytica]
MTQATMILNKMGINLENTAEVEVNGVSFTFHRDSAAYDAFVNDLKDDNKITPAKDYLLAIIDPTQRAELLEIINLPNLALMLAAKVNEVFLPKFNITVKTLNAVLKA